ncbi:MAG: lipoprotein, partial [Acidimicrobiia bacterium]
MRVPYVVVIIAALALVLSACGESGPLEGVGDRAGAWVTAATLPTTTSPPVVIEVGNEGLVGATDILWVNDDIGPGEPHDDPQAMIST